MEKGRRGLAKLEGTWWICKASILLINATACSSDLEPGSRKLDQGLPRSTSHQSPSGSSLLPTGSSLLPACLMDLCFAQWVGSG